VGDDSFSRWTNRFDQLAASQCRTGGSSTIVSGLPPLGRKRELESS
jgi:hypothetical protein